MKTHRWEESKFKGMTEIQFVKEIQEKHTTLSTLITEKVLPGLVSRGAIEVSRLASNGRQVLTEDELRDAVPHLLWVMLKQDFERAVHVPLVYYLGWLTDSLPDGLSLLDPDAEFALPICTPEVRTRLLADCTQGHEECSIHPEILDLLIACIERDPCMTLPHLGDVSCGKIAIDAMGVDMRRAFYTRRREPSHG